MIYHGDNYHYCLECKCAIKYGGIVTQGKWGYYCERCSIINSITEKFRRLAMSNIKITAEVDGKIVPLNTISDETFRAIKAAARIEELPVARWATCSSDPRLLFKPMRNIELKVGNVYALDLKHGISTCNWKPGQDEKIVASQYRRVTPQL